MTVQVPGGPYPWYIIERAAPQLDMTAPVDLDDMRPGLAYWLPPPSPRGLVTPRIASPAAVIQQARMQHVIGYNDLAAWAGIHPCTLAAWMDGDETPHGPAWDMLLSMLVSMPQTLTTTAGARIRMLFRNHQAAPEDDKILAALYNAAMDSAGLQIDCLGSFTVLVQDRTLEIKPIPTAAVDELNARAYVSYGLWCALHD